MMYYFLQTSLLLLVSYFLGCWLGCVLRTYVRSNAPAPVRAAAGSESTRPAATAARSPVMAAPSIPVTPRPASATERMFRRADSDRAAEQPAQVPRAPVSGPAAAPAAAAPMVAPALAPAPTAARAPAAAPAPTQLPTPMPVPIQVQSPALVPGAVSVEAGRSAPVTGVSVTAAAAAAAAAAIAQGRAREAVAGRPPASLPAATPAPAPPPASASAPATAAMPAPIAAPAPAPARMTLPAAGAASGVSGVAVGGHNEASAPAVPVAAAVGHDDLKRVRGIGPEIEAALHRVGVRRYAEIAGWSASDVDKVSKTLGLKGRIEHENWIEQAQVLSKSGETAFSRRYDRGEMETVPAPKPQPVAVTAEPKVAPASVPMPTPAAPAATAAQATSADTSSRAAISAATVAAAAAAAQRAQAAVTAAQTAARGNDGGFAGRGGLDLRVVPHSIRPLEG